MSRLAAVVNLGDGVFVLAPSAVGAIDVDEDDGDGFVAQATVRVELEDGRRTRDLAFGNGTSPVKALQSLVRQGVPILIRCGRRTSFVPLAGEGVSHYDRSRYRRPARRPRARGAGRPCGGRRRAATGSSSSSTDPSDPSEPDDPDPARPRRGAAVGGEDR